MRPRLLPLAILSTAALAATVATQTPPCESHNLGPYVSTAITACPFVGRNPLSRAYEFSPQQTITVQAGSIFTGSPLHDDYMRLEIWDHDPVANEPMNRLCVGTMFSPMSATPNWLGTNFDFAPTLTAGTKYWFVWIDPCGSHLPEDPGGVPLPRRTRQATNAWGALGSGAGKFQLFCNPLNAAGVSSFGAPCQTSAAQLATTFTNSAASAGNASYVIEGTNLPPGALVLLTIGVNANWPSVPLGPQWPTGCNLNTDIVFSAPSTTGTAEIGDQPVSPRPPAFGHARFPLALSGLPVGAYFAVQIYGVDTGFATAITAVSTNALRTTTQ